MSFKEVRDALIMAYADGYLDDEEFMILFDYYKSDNPSYPYWDFQPFCLDDFDSSECESSFRVAKDDLAALRDALRIPASFTCPQGTVCDGMEGLCLLLKRLAYPCRYFDLIYTFARPVPITCPVDLSSVASCPAPTQKKRKTMKPRVPSSSQVLRAKIVSPPIEASPPEFDLVYTILESVNHLFKP